MWNKNAGLKKTTEKATRHYSVTYPWSEPSFHVTCHMSQYLTHTQKSRALCPAAAEVQMVCLYASLTQRCSFTSSPFCLLLLDSVHQRSTSVTPLSFALLSLRPPFHLSLSLSSYNLSLCPLVIIVSIFLTHDLFSCWSLSPMALTLTRADEWVILLHCTQPSLSMFGNGSFDSFLSVPRWMAEAQSWKPCSYHKEHVNCKATKPTSD